jgi:transposase
MRTDVAGFTTFIGVDLHKCTVTLRAACADGELLGQLTCNTKCVERIAEWITNLPGPKWMAVEAGPFVEWFIDRYTPCVDRMDIADASDFSLRSGKRRKNDPNDAVDIALRLARGECPLGYIADPQLMQLRKFGRHWRQLSRSLAKVLHHVKSTLNRLNFAGPVRLDAAALQRYLLANVERFCADDLTMLWQHQRRLVEIEQDRAQSERRISELMRAAEFAGLRGILESVPGVGLVTSATLIAEIGDFSRFADSKAIGRHAGLAPPVYASGNSNRLGHICKTGSPDLRWVLQQAAWTAIRCDAAFKKTWLRIATTAGGLAPLRLC